MMNSVNLIGRLTKEPEIRYTNTNGKAVANFTLAVRRDRQQEGQQEADFITVVAWDKLAEFSGKNFKKGMKIAVNGSFQSRKWTDDNKNNHYVIEVVANRLYYADSKKEYEIETEEELPV